VQADRLQSSNIAANAVLPPPPPPASRQPSQTEARVQLLERLNGALTTRDTPRGLVITVTDAGFGGSALRPQASEAVKRVAGILASQRGLRVAVEGHTDSAETRELSAQRAGAVRSALVASGLPANEITSQGLGNSRLIDSNASEAGKIENRRVEIVVSGDTIGALPFWDRTYSVAPRR
jgi:outer membrane protein OmpA-like peptidoglycan-associated protein